MWILYSLCLVVSASGQNDVRLPPSMTRNPDKEVIFRQFANITLTCGAEGTPNLTFEWKRSGRNLNLTSPTFTILGVSVGDLTIFNATKRDDGFYQCFATNQYGTAISVVAHIQQAFLNRSAQGRPMPNIVNMTVQEGHPFVISAARINSLPTPTYRWNTATSKSSRFQTSQRVLQAWNGDLHFAYALKEDELNGSVYKSVAVNAFTGQRSNGIYTRVIVAQGSGYPPNFPPNITYFAKSQEVALIGRSIELKCFSSGRPLPNITWSWPRNALPPGRHSISTEHYQTLLIISNISEFDEGDYICSANNSEGTASHTLDIRVESEPIFRQEYDGPRNVNVTEGDSIIFNCSTFAKPQATIVWLRNGKPIDVTNPLKRYVFSNDSKSLTIRNVCRVCDGRKNKTDLTVIQCNASNVHGYAFAQGYLNVLMRTKVTLLTESTFVQVDLTKENRFQFDCRATSDPSTPPTVRWYKVGEQGEELVYSDSINVYIKDGNLTIHTEPNCSTTCEKYLGEYKCVSDNGYTQDNATVILNGSTGSCPRKCPEVNDTKVNLSRSYCNGCFDSRDLHANSAKENASNQTTIAVITSLLPDLTTQSEDLSSGNLSNEIMIETEGIDSTTKEEVESGRNNNSNGEDIRTSSVNKSALNETMAAAKMTRSLTALSANSEGLSQDNLNTPMTITNQGRYSRTNGEVESSLKQRSNEKETKANHEPEDALNKTMAAVITNPLQALTTRSENVDDLKTTAPKIQHVVAENTYQLSALTSKNESLSLENLNSSIMILNRLADLLRDRTITLNETEIKSIVQAVDNILHPKNSNAWKKLNDVHNGPAVPFVQTILSIMDDFGLILCELSTPGHVNISIENLVLEAWSFEKSDRPVKVEFPYGSPWGENRGDRISISMETLNEKIQPTLTMWGVYYRTIHDQLPGKQHSEVVNSRVLSFSIGGLKTNETLEKPVLITLQHNEERRRIYRRTCSFWNFARGDWDSYGCSVMSTNKTHTICSCDHLTNFAILMSRNPMYDKMLSIISIVGCSISVAALVLTVIVYALTWKHAKSSQAALLLNLCIALIIAYIIFMAGADKIESSGYSMVGCQVVAVLLHYFFLVAFFIMLAEGIDMVLYIFFVFHVRRTRETIMLIASAWVLPLIIVGVSLGVTKREGYGHKEACWLSIENGLIWAFIGPVLCIIAINLVILIIILRLISQKKALLAGNGKKRDEIRATIWNLSVMCPVLGLGWLFGVFSVSFDHVAFQYVFVIANSLHGMLIFIIYALFHNKKMNEQISAVYSKFVGCCGKTGPSVFYKLSSSQDNSTSSTSNTQLTSAQEKSTHGAAPGYGVIATTLVSSAREPGERCSGDPLLPKQHPQKGQNK